MAALSLSERIVPMNERHPAAKKGMVKEPLMSARYPPSAGPKAWPTPKNRVMNPSPAGAERGPTKSPTAAATIVGILQAVSPNIMAEI